MTSIWRGWCSASGGATASWQGKEKLERVSRRESPLNLSENWLLRRRGSGVGRWGESTYKLLSHKG